MAKQNNIPVLGLAAIVQYLGASTRRRYVQVLLVVAVLVPGVKSKLVGSEPEDPDKNPFETLASLPLDLLEQGVALVATVAALLVTLNAVFWAVLGVLVESVFGLLAALIRSDFRPLAHANDTWAIWRRVLKLIRKALLQNWHWQMAAASTFDKPCESAPGSTAGQAFSFCSQPDLRYTDSGLRITYRLEAGRLRFTRYERSLRAAPTQPEALFTSSIMSFHDRRLGALESSIDFDMLAASNDRVFLKRKGLNQFYFGIPEEIFAGTGEVVLVKDVPQQTRPVPSLYFKLDPEPDAPDSSALVAQISTAPDNAGRRSLALYPPHPQAERLPALQVAIGSGALPVQLVSVKPRTLYRIDTRPPRLGNVAQMPTSLQSIAVRPANLFTGSLLSGTRVLGTEAVVPMEFAFDRVLAMGVGNFHFYESWTDDHGGEIQWLRKQGLFGLGLNPALYGLFNGPLWDGEGAIDGTCNFYILVRLPRKSGPARHGILWCDEQTFFTKRWRLLHPDDIEPAHFNPPDDINLSVHALVANDSNPGILSRQYDFDKGRFLASDPFEHEGWIDDSSRMAVARQVVAVTGRRDGVPTLFTLNYSYGSLDRIWRQRRFPSNPPGLSPTAAALLDPRVQPQTIQLREDMTLSVAGRGQPAPSALPVAGRWVQRYLPCDRRMPEEQREGSIDVARFEHPWRFLPQPVFDRMARFSHFGVYRTVDSRNQYYEVERIGDAEAPLLSGRWDDGALLKDDDKRLSIRARKFRWGEFQDEAKAADYLRDDLPAAIRADRELDSMGDRYFHSWQDAPDRRVEYRRSTTSMHHDMARFRLLDRGPCGWILVWDDKRDDDLVAICDLPRVASLADASEPTATPPAPALPVPAGLPVPAVGGLDGLRRVRLRLLANHRVTSLPCVVRLRFECLQQSPDSGGFVTLSFDTPLSLANAMRNLWKLCVWSWPDADADPIPLLEIVNLTEVFRLRRPYGGTGLTFTSDGTHNLSGDRLRLLKATQATTAGTSAWFEDITGHVSTPDAIDFAAG